MLSKNRGKFNYATEKSSVETETPLKVLNITDEAAVYSGEFELPSARFRYAKWTDLENVEIKGSELRYCTVIKSSVSP